MHTIPIWRIHLSREALNRIQSAKAGPCIALNELSLYRAKFCTECPYSNHRRVVSFYFRQVNGKPPSDPKCAQDVMDTIAKKQPAPERLHKTWQKHRGLGSSSNRSRGRLISSWDRQNYHTKEKGVDHGGRLVVADSLLPIIIAK
jgi:hypothetical protein